MKLSERLLKKAAYFRSLSPSLVAVDMLKQAGMAEDEAVAQVAQLEMEKTAADGMVAAGVDYDKALEMIKTSGIKISELDGFGTEKQVEELAWEELIKLASDVQELEAEIETLRVKAVDGELAIEKAAELQEALDQIPEAVQAEPEALTKLASTGAFTNADLEALLRLPSETLTKVASANEAPRRMGKGAGMAVDSVDPITAFAFGLGR